MTPLQFMICESWWQSRGRTVPEARSGAYAIMVRTWKRYAFWGMH
jgi:hypothetical protein